MISKTFMTKDNFQPIFKYLDKMEIRIKEDLIDVIHKELRPVKTAIANLAGEVRQIREENAVANHRFKRLEDWAKPVGKKLDIPFNT